MENKMGKLVEAADTLKSTKIDEMLSILNETEQAMKQENSKLPETVFVSYFLQYFKNGEVFDNQTPLHLKWVENSGSPFNEVDIIDDNGDVIFTTPPLVAKPDTSSEVLTNTNFSKITTEYNLRNARLTVDAENFANSKLIPLGSEIKPTEAIETHRRKWDEIFDKYDKKDKTNPKLPYFSSMLDDELDY